MFKKDYNKVSKIKQYGRKIQPSIYRKAFEEYKLFDISLTELAKKLGISFETLREYLENRFGKDYKEVARQKYDADEARRKGRIAESIALRFLEISGFRAEDVRYKHVLKGTLQRPDFLVGDMFVEVKASYLPIKSTIDYKGIVTRYLGKEVKLDGRIITKG